MRNTKIILTALIGSVALMACNTTSAPSVLSKEDAKSLKTIAPLALNGLANSLRQGGSSIVTSGLDSGAQLAAAFGKTLAPQALNAQNLKPQAVTGTCGPSIPPVDADGDKLIVNFSYTYDCTVTFSPSFKFTAKGSLRTNDSNDNDANSGYTTDGEIRYAFVFTNTNTNESSTFDFIVKWNATASNAQNGTFKVATDQRVIFLPDTDKSEFSYVLTAAYTPDNDGNTQRFDAGSVQFDGQVAFTNAKKQLSRFRLATTTDLHFGPACTRGLDRGAVRAEDESNLLGTKNNVFTLTVTSCDTWVATYNSETIF